MRRQIRINDASRPHTGRVNRRLGLLPLITCRSKPWLSGAGCASSKQDCLAPSSGRKLPLYTHLIYARWTREAARSTAVDGRSHRLISNGVLVWMREVWFDSWSRVCEFLNSFVLNSIEKIEKIYFDRLNYLRNIWTR